MEPLARPLCPRCGYDQSGAVATWGDSCPLRGQCPECGLEFAWGQAYFPDRERLRGFFEHARGPWEWRLWPWVTLAWALLPWVFWRKVTVFVKPSPRRMFLWLALTIGPLWLAGAVVTAGWGQLGATGLAKEVINCLADPIVRYEDWNQYPFWTTWGARREWMWDPRRYLRAAAPFAIFCLAWPVLFAALGETMRRCRLRRAHVLRSTVYSFAWVPILAGLLLTDKVYQAVEHHAPMLARSIGMWDRPSGLLFRHRVWLVSGLTLWIGLWWLLAIRRGFRLPHAWAVWLLLGVASALLTVNIMLAPLWIGGILRQAGLF